MNIGHSHRRRWMLAATSVLFAAAGVGVASVAGAAQEVKIYASDNGGPCFTTTAGQPCDGTNPHVTVHTGDTVTWDFTTGTTVHNAISENAVPEDPNWEPFDSGYSYAVPTASFTFTAPGTYEFLCQVHANQNMRGTITVEGAPVEGTPTPAPSATPSATATPVPTARPTVVATNDDHTSTPAPGHAARDDIKPRLARVSATRVRSGVRLRFWLSEPATVKIAAVRRGSKRRAASETVQAPAGMRAMTLRTRALRKGTYAVTLAPVDAMGNRGVTVKRTLRVR